MAELYGMSQTVEELVKKPTILRTNHSEDPTLKFPDHLLRSIFSYLKYQDLVHVSLVSKNWHRNTPSYCALDIDESLFFENIPSTSLAYVQKSHNFLDWIHSSLETCKIRLSKAEKRILRIQFNRSESSHNLMKLIDENNFHEVYLRFGNGLYGLYDSLPCIFPSTCLTVLHLTRCALEEQIFSSEEKFNSLQELKLDDVELWGETLSKFISKCPYIRELSLLNCYCLWHIVLPKLDSLKKLYVKLNTYQDISSIQVIAPNLQVFHFVYSSLKQVAINMDIRACKMLREFHLDCLKFPNGLDHEKFCSDFPHLETLLLGPCETWKPVKIWSLSLKTLILFFTRMFEYSRTGVVSAPSLCYYEYIGTTFKPFLAPNDTPKFLKTRIILVYSMEKINRAWFPKLRSHLKNFSNRITLSLCIREEKTKFSMGELRGHLWSKLIGRAPTQPLHYIKHLELDMRLELFPREYLMKYIIDTLFWMSHPETLTLLIPYGFEALAHGVCKELESRREGNCCAEDKCWRHFLKDFEVHEQVDYVKDKLTLVFIFTWQFIVRSRVRAVKTTSCRNAK